MRTLLTLLLLGATAFSAPVPKELTQTPLERLQGRWEIVTYDGGEGQKVQTGDLASLTVTIKGEKLSAEKSSGPIHQQVAVKWDFETKPMRLVIPSSCGQTIPGIIKFEDDKFYWCHGYTESPPPKEFKGGQGYHCIVFKRIGK